MNFEINKNDNGDFIYNAICKIHTQIVNKQDIYEVLKEYFDNSGTLKELFDVLAVLCEYHSKNIKEFNIRRYNYDN